MKKGICFGVSVGPGQSDLITYQAIEVIKTTDVVFLPSFPKEDCLAYKIIKQIMPDIDKKQLCPEPFTMSRDVEVMHKRHLEIFENAKQYLDEGKNIAFLTLGDVSLYSTYLYIHEMLLENGYYSKMINGISSIQAIASKLGISLAMGSDEMHVFPNANDIDRKLNYSGTKIFMKSGKNMPALIQGIQSFCKENPKTRAMGISNYGMENEVVAGNVDELERLAGYFSVIIVK